LGVGEKDNGHGHEETSNNEEFGVAGTVVLLVVCVPFRSTGAAQTLRDIPVKQTQVTVTQAPHIVSLQGFLHAYINQRPI
jgi:hypothetical protein